MVSTAEFISYRPQPRNPQEQFKRGVEQVMVGWGETVQVQLEAGVAGAMLGALGGVMKKTFGLSKESLTATVVKSAETGFKRSWFVGPFVVPDRFNPKAKALGFKKTGFFDNVWTALVNWRMYANKSPFENAKFLTKAVVSTASNPVSWRGLSEVAKALGTIALR